MIGCFSRGCEVEQTVFLAIVSSSTDDLLMDKTKINEKKKQIQIQVLSRCPI